MFDSVVIVSCLLTPGLENPTLWAWLRSSSNESSSVILCLMLTPFVSWLGTTPLPETRVNPHRYDFFGNCTDAIWTETKQLQYLLSVDFLYWYDDTVSYPAFFPPVVCRWNVNKIIYRTPSYVTWCHNTVTMLYWLRLKCLPASQLIEDQVTVHWAQWICWRDWGIEFHTPCWSPFDRFLPTLMYF